jgi:tRNA (guanine-N7-)-methyltransferase
VRAFFGRRKGHKLRSRQIELLRTLLPRFAIDLSRPAPRELNALFPVPVSEVHLEIGFGGGENMIARAEAQPQTGIIGVEPFVNGMVKALSAMTSRGLQNIRLYSGDAATLLPWLPAASLSRIDLIHPDPWPKRRHWKRRFIQHATVAQFARILRLGGEVRFATDVADYAAWSLLRFLPSPDFEWTAEHADDWRKPWSDFISTRYYTKAALHQRLPSFLIFRRV